MKLAKASSFAKKAPPMMKSGKAVGLVRSAPSEIYLHGLLAGFREAVTFLGMDEAAPLSSLDSYIYDFIKINSKVQPTFCTWGLI